MLRGLRGGAGRAGGTSMREVEGRNTLLGGTLVMAVLALTTPSWATTPFAPQPLGGPYTPETAPSPPSTIYDAPGYYGYYSRGYYPYYGGGFPRPARRVLAEHTPPDPRPTRWVEPRP